MKVKVEFQYKNEDSERPEDCVQDDEFFTESGEFIPIPDVGDSVSYRYGGKGVACKVVSRHFSYVSGWCIVNIVVTDMKPGEMAARLKE
jgi:hypothetical protein